MPSSRSLGRLCAGALLGAALALLAGCAQPPATPPATPETPARPSPAPTPAERPAAPRASHAATPRDYRKDAAAHLYHLNAERIHVGKLPPMLYAVGVLEVEVDRNGQVRNLRWMRAPRHAPEVIREIERTVHAAAPFPRPERLGRVLYVDTWLWNRDGRFQLDTLTEGQLQGM